MKFHGTDRRSWKISYCGDYQFQNDRGHFFCWYRQTFLEMVGSFEEVKQVCESHFKKLQEAEHRRFLDEI